MTGSRSTGNETDSDPDHIAENFNVFDFALSHEEMQRVSGLTEADRRLIDPRGLAPAWD